MNIFNKWSNWEDVEILYNATTYQEYLIQCRRHKNGKVEFRTVNIQKYAKLSEKGLKFFKFI